MNFFFLWNLDVSIFSPWYFSPFICLIILLCFWNLYNVLLSLTFLLSYNIFYYSYNGFTQVMYLMNHSFFLNIISFLIVGPFRSFIFTHGYLVSRNYIYFLQSYPFVHFSFTYFTFCFHLLTFDISYYP